MAEKKKKQAPFGCIFWIAFILLVFVLFFINKNNIAGALRSLEESGFFNKKEDIERGPNLTPQTREDGDLHLKIQPEPEDKKAENNGEESRQEPSGGERSEPEQEKPRQNDITELTSPEETGESTGGRKKEQEKPSPVKENSNSEKETDSETASSQKPAVVVPMRKQRLYFVSIDSEGRVLRQEVVKDIPKSDSPLADALTALFEGPSDSEKKRGLISLIPDGTRLLSAVVKDGTATLNLSEEFQFNQYGIEGYLAQLSQIVFTATTFPTVTSVQFLIDGQRREYLGAEGVWIGTPLGRKEFTN